MAQRFSMSTGKISTGALAAAGNKGLIILNPVTDMGAITEVWCSFGAVADQAGVALRLVRVTTPGTIAGTAGTVAKDDPGSAAANWTGLTNLATEPTTYETLRELGYVPTQKGQLGLFFPLGREVIAAAGGSRLGLVLTNDGAGAMTAVDLRASLVWEI